MGVACIPIRLKTSILFDREVATRALPIPSAGPDAPHLPKSHRHPRESGGPASVDANPLADVLLTCAKSILPSTFLRTAIAERFILASHGEREELVTSPMRSM